MELGNDFIEELFKASITSEKTVTILDKHLSFELLPNEAYKTIWKEIKSFYRLNTKLPSIGLLSQSIESEPKEELKKECRHILSSMKGIVVHDVHDQLIKKFEDYKKKLEFKIVYNEVFDLYSAGKQDKAIELMAFRSEEISNFSLKDAEFEKVFSSFEERNRKRQEKDKDLGSNRIPSGIHEFDWVTKGGFKQGTSFLGMAMSGAGKSTYLRWVAIHAARLGYRVVIFSLEGTEEQTFDSIDACWTSTPLEDMEFGQLEEKKQEKIKKAVQGVISNGGEIFVKCAETFDSFSIEEARNYVIELEKIEGKVDLVLFDYLELFKVGGNFPGDSGERRRREAVSNKMTNIAIELKCVVGAMTQAMDIPPQKFNDPDFFLTRTDVSEFKGVVKPFSYFFTLNQTSDEKIQGINRIYCDKFRFHPDGQIITISQAMNIGRFYDSHKTLKLHWDSARKKKK